MDSAGYKQLVPGLIFLKYISDWFSVQYAALERENTPSPKAGGYMNTAISKFAEKKGKSGSKVATDDLPAPCPGVFYVYVIKCQGEAFYIGQTNNIPRRWQEHKAGKGADYTKKNPPLYMAYYEAFSNRKKRFYTRGPVALRKFRLNHR